MANTAMQAFGWVLGLLAWGATIAMLLSEQWRTSSILGDSAAAIDIQGRHDGLWATCTKYPSGETHCTFFGTEIGEVLGVIIGCRALLIIAIIFGIIAALIIVFSFKCSKHGPQEQEKKAQIGKYGGSVYLACGVCVTVAAAWYITDVYMTITLPDPKGRPMKWITGESVQMALAAGILWLIGSVFVLLGSRTSRRDIMMYEHKTPLHQEYI
ncbi:claudin-19-like [Styela clava]|uniref:claudin-19-like n=1 Tax=Styela clava TaxID=7725 RepID=UPI0019395628|nr:claudin-19-like [Styela clava]